jgi:hypothetical protein
MEGIRNREDAEANLGLHHQNDCSEEAELPLC